MNFKLRRFQEVLREHFPGLNAAFDLNEEGKLLPFSHRFSEVDEVYIIGTLKKVSDQGFPDFYTVQCTHHFPGYSTKGEEKSKKSLAIHVSQLLQLLNDKRAEAKSRQNENKQTPKIEQA